jgi:integrase
MPRKVKSVDLGTRTARAKLKVRTKPYWWPVDRGLHLGYRRNKGGGQWVWRIYLGGQRYDTDTFAAADDRAEANGTSILDWDQAVKKAREIRDARERRKAGGEDPAAPYTIAVAVQEYGADLRARKGDKAARGVEGRLRKHLLPVLGERRLADLTAGELAKWRNGMVDLAGDEDEVRRSRDSANRVLSMAKAAFNLAFNSGKVADDRAWRRVKAFRGVGEARKVFLTEDQLQRLVDACGPGLRELVLIGAWTGCRLGELTLARVRDFDATESTLTVRSGKMGGRGSREVSLEKQAVALCRRLESGKRPGDYLFTTAAGGPWTPSLHDRPFEAAAAKAGLDPATVFYSLRHSYISRALKRVPTKAVADHCGTSVAMLQRYYAKFIPSDMQQYVAEAAPQLRVDADQKVVQIRPAG